MQGYCYARQQKILDALKNYDKAMNIFESIYNGPNHSEMIKLYLNLADTKEKFI